MQTVQYISVADPKWQNTVEFSSVKIKPQTAIQPLDPVYGRSFSTLLLTKYS